VARCVDVATQWRRHERHHPVSEQPGNITDKELILPSGSTVFKKIKREERRTLDPLMRTDLRDAPPDAGSWVIFFALG
jgi:hypothetical protein